MNGEWKKNHFKSYWISFECNNKFVLSSTIYGASYFPSFEAAGTEVVIIIISKYLVELNWLIPCFYLGLSIQWQKRERIENAEIIFFEPGVAQIQIKPANRNSNESCSIRFPNWDTLVRTNGITDETTNDQKLKYSILSEWKRFVWTRETDVSIENVNYAIQRMSIFHDSYNYER